MNIFIGIFLSIYERNIFIVGVPEKIKKMKFGEYLQMNLTSEWCSQYILYEDLKEFLVEVASKAPSITVTNPRLSRQQYFLLADEEFFRVRKFSFG